MQETPATQKLFSFNTLFKYKNGVNRAAPDLIPDYLDTMAAPETKAAFEELKKWTDQNGLTYPRLQFPVAFGTSEGYYTGVCATEDIGKEEVLYSAPSKMLLSTKKAFYSDIQKVFYENPSIFGRHHGPSEDNILIAYILYEMGKGKESFWYPYFQVLPKDTDILRDWDYVDIAELQDECIRD